MLVVLKIKDEYYYLVKFVASVVYMGGVIDAGYEFEEKDMKQKR